MSFFRKHRTASYIFIVAFIVRLCLFFFNFAQNDYELIPTIMGEDGYYEISQNLLAGNGFSFDTEPPYDPNSLRPPVWPALIALFAKVGGYPLAALIEMLMGSFIPVLGLMIARYIIGDRAKYVGWIIVFLPFSVLLSFIFYTETSFTFFFLLSILFLFRYIENQTLRSIIWSSVFLGLAALIKPTVQYFPILVPIGLFWIFRKNISRKIIKEAFLFMLVAVLIMAPWFYRNYKEFGSWGMSAQPAFNLYVYVVPTLLAIDNGTSFATEVAKIVDKPDFSLDTITLANEDYYKKQAYAVIAEHKLALVKSIGITLVTFFTHDGMHTVLKYSGIKIENIVSKPVIFLAAHPIEAIKFAIQYAQSPAIVIIIMRLAWFAAFFLFIFGGIAYIRKHGLQPHILTLLCIVLYFALTTSINGMGVNARFRVPVESLIITVAIYGLFVIKERLFRSRAL